MASPRFLGEWSAPVERRVDGASDGRRPAGKLGREASGRQGCRARWPNSWSDGEFAVVWRQFVAAGSEYLEHEVHELPELE